MAVWPAMRGAGEQWEPVEASSGPPPPSLHNRPVSTTRMLGAELLAYEAADGGRRGRNSCCQLSAERTLTARSVPRERSIFPLSGSWPGVGLHCPTEGDVRGRAATTCGVNPVDAQVRRVSVSSSDRGPSGRPHASDQHLRARQRSPLVGLVRRLARAHGVVPHPCAGMPRPIHGGSWTTAPDGWTVQELLVGWGSSPRTDAKTDSPRSATQAVARLSFFSIVILLEGRLCSPRPEADLGQVRDSLDNS